MLDVSALVNVSPKSQLHELMNPAVANEVSVNTTGRLRHESTRKYPGRKMGYICTIPIAVSAHPSPEAPITVTINVPVSE